MLVIFEATCEFDTNLRRNEQVGVEKFDLFN